MDGILANLTAICDLADRYRALVMVDDSHAVGFIGRERPRHARGQRRDGPRRHHHRHARQGAGRRLGRLHLRPARDHRLAAPALAPYLFSNTPRAVDRRRDLAVLDLLEGSSDLRQKLRDNAAHFRAG